MCDVHGGAAVSSASIRTAESGLTGVLPISLVHLPLKAPPFVHAVWSLIPPADETADEACNMDYMYHIYARRVTDEHVKGATFCTYGLSFMSGWMSEASL